MTDPTDAELLEFVARFAGWNNVTRGKEFPSSREQRWFGWRDGHRKILPDYLGSVDAWLRDVWPKMLELNPRGTFAVGWVLKLDQVIDVKYAPPYALAVNATARQRCLALWRALDGKLPEGGKP